MTIECCPHHSTETEACSCETCILMRVIATSPTRPIDPEVLRELLEKSRMEVT